MSDIIQVTPSCTVIPLEPTLAFFTSIFGIPNARPQWKATPTSIAKPRVPHPRATRSPTGHPLEIAASPTTSTFATSIASTPNSSPSSTLRPRRMSTERQPALRPTRASRPRSRRQLNRLRPIHSRSRQHPRVMLVKVCWAVARTFRRASSVLTRHLDFPCYR
jgi:hypothetical protein